MAYLYQDPNDPNNPQNQQPGGAPPAPGQTTPPPTGAGGSLLGGGAAAAATPAGSSSGAAAPSSSGWTNLRAYLDANQDQAPGLADQLAGNVTQQGTAAKNAVSGAVNDYNANLAQTGPGDFNALLSKASDPVAFSQNPDDVSKFQKLESGVFNDPGTFEGQANYGDVANKVTAAQGLPALVNSEGGQKELLKGINPQETAGQSSLDQLLLAGVPEASSKLSAAAQPFSNLRGMLDSSAQGADASRTKAITDTGTAKDRIQNEFTQPLSGYEGALNNYAGMVNNSNAKPLDPGTIREQWDSILQSLAFNGNKDQDLEKIFPKDATLPRIQALQKMLGKTGQYPVTTF